MKSNVLRAFCDAFFPYMNASNVTYCVLRGFEKLPFYTRNDIDIAVDPRDVGFVISGIRRIAFENGWHVVSVYRRSEFCRIIMFHPDYEKSLLPIDLVSSLSYRGIRYANLESVLKNRRMINGFFAADPASEFGVSLLGRILTKRASSLSDGKRNHFCEVIESNRAACTAFLRNNVGSELEAKIRRCIENEEWSDLNLLRIELIFQLWKTNGLFHTPIAVFKAAFTTLRDKFGRRGVMDVRGGLFVVLLGPDGSGKTSLAVELKTAVSPVFNNIRLYHGRFKLFPELGSLLRVFKRGGDSEESFGSHSMNRRSISKLRANLNVFYYGLEYVAGHFVIFGNIKKNNLVLYDRYFYDYHLHPEYVNASRFLVRFMQTIIPKPDLVLLVKCDPAIIYQRKQELSEKEIERQQNLLDELGRALPNGHFVRTDCDMEESLRQAKALMFDAMVDGGEGT